MHVVVAALELPMFINVHDTRIYDRKGAMPTIECLAYKFPWISKILADGDSGEFFSCG